jgi:hypothetical protein
MMTLRKGKAAVAVLAAVTFLGAGVIVAWNDARGQNAAAGAMGDELRQKAQARVKAAEDVVARIEKRIQGQAEPLCCEDAGKVTAGEAFDFRADDKSDVGTLSWTRVPPDAAE